MNEQSCVNIRVGNMRDAAVKQVAYVVIRRRSRLLLIICDLESKI